MGIRARQKVIREFDKKIVIDAYLEAIEKIECLRYLEYGIPLKMVITNYMGIEIDTPEDLIKAIGLLQ